MDHKELEGHQGKEEAEPQQAYKVFVEGFS